MHCFTRSEVAPHKHGIIRRSCVCVFLEKALARDVSLVEALKAVQDSGVQLTSRRIREGEVFLTASHNSECLKAAVRSLSEAARLPVMEVTEAECRALFQGQFGQVLAVMDDCLHPEDRVGRTEHLPELNTEDVDQ